MPIQIPSSFFTTLQKQILNFVWVGKRARCSSNLQSKNKSVGGMGLPLLKDYHTAAVLDQLKNWFSNPTIKPWCQIELAWLNNKSPLSLLMASILAKNSKISNHPTIQATVQAWSELRLKGNEFYATANIPIPLESLQWIIPNIRLHKWLENNIPNLADITIGDTLLPFTTIQQKFSIPNSEFLTYTQISFYYQKTKSTHISIIEKVRTYMQSCNPKLKGITLIYNSLKSKDAFTKHKPLVNWEKELGKEFSDLQWKNSIHFLMLKL